MPRLSELTDFDPMGSFTGAQPTAAPAEVPSPLSNNVDKILNSIFRPDEKRLQLWPERLVRAGATAAGEVASGAVPQWAVDPKSGDVHTSPQMVEKAQEVSALAGTGGLGGTGKARLSTKELEKLDTNPLPSKFKVGTKDDTGIWFLDGDKPVYAQARRDSLDKLFGDRAKEFDNFQSVSGTSEKGGPITVWYREGQKDKALKEIQNFKDKQAATTDAEKAKLHYESGLNLGYPEDKARAFAYKRFGVDPAPGGEVVLGATPSLRPALKYKDKLYKGKPGQEHMDVIPNSLYPEFQQMAMKGEDISHYNFGFVNDKGHFLSREDALKYGIDNGLIDPQAGKYGALTSTLFSDSSKPGVAIEAAKPSYKIGEKYHQLVPEIKNVEVADLKNLNMHEVPNMTPDKAEKYKQYLNEPINVSMFSDGTLRITDGHHRVAAARLLGIKELPVKLQAINAKGENIQKLIKSDVPTLPPGYELKPVEYNPFEQKT